MNKYQIIVAAPNLPGKYDDMSDALCRAIWLAQERIGDRKFAKIASAYANRSGIRKTKSMTHRSYQIRKARKNNYKSKRKRY